MTLNIVRQKLGLNAKQLLSVIVLVSSGFFWFFLSAVVLERFTTRLGYYENLLVLFINFGATAASALVGAFFSNENRNIRFLKIWMAIGAVASVVPLAIDMTALPGVAAVALLWGATLGFGMPASMEYLTGNTTVEGRGRVGAIVFFVTFVSIFIAGAVLEALSYQMQIVTLAVFRVAGLSLFVLLNPTGVSTQKTTSSYLNIVRERSFVLYFSAWAMFSLVNYLNIPILNKHFGEDFASSYATIETIITAMLAPLSGVLCDIVGRKAVIIFGFVSLGLGYAVLGAFPSSFAGWYFYTVADGVAWGMLGVVYFMIIWGDLAYEKSSTKYFALGALPLLFSGLLQRIVGPDLAGAVSVTAVFSLASFFLFLAVLPLLYAPETLPEKKIRERELKDYVKKATKAREKYV